MSEERLDRKVTVILATDVVGYSRHVEENESLTIKTYSAREVILRTLIEDFEGRVFNTGGDSVLAEFSIAVDAVECAAAFQLRIAEINSQPDTECRLEFRIGVNMGDVIQKDTDLLGDGVNIAWSLKHLHSKVAFVYLPNPFTISCLLKPILLLITLAFRGLKTINSMLLI